MRFAVRSLCLALLPLAAACNGDDGSSPTGPAHTPPAATRIINVSGNLAFGDVLVGGQRDLSYTITNSGNATLTVTGTTVTGGLDAHTIASWTNGQIAGGRFTDGHGAVPADCGRQLQRDDLRERRSNERLKHIGYFRCGAGPGGRRVPGPGSTAWNAATARALCRTLSAALEAPFRQGRPCR